MSDIAPNDFAAPGGLKIERLVDDHGAVIALFGELDLESAPELERQLRELNGTNSGRLLIDLSGLEFMDSTGLAVMVRTQRAARDDGHRLSLRPGPTQVQRLFELTGVLRGFVFED
jgi:anti-anti-sigma factor